MWYQGNALDTMIDYISITKNEQSGAQLGTKIDLLWPDAVKEGRWFDDFGWWGIAMLNAARHYTLLGKSTGESYGQKAREMLDQMAYASQVWELYRNHQSPPYESGAACDAGLWSAYAPRFEGGVWNSLYGTSFNCPTDMDPSTGAAYASGDPSDIYINPKQNTVTNGLHLVLSARYYRQFGDSQVFKLADDAWLWFYNWLSLPDIPVDQCLGMTNSHCDTLEDANVVKPSLLDRHTNLVRERACTFALYDGCYAIDPVYKCNSVNRDAMIWTGDQGLVIGAMVDLMDIEGVDDPPESDSIKQILEGVLGYLTQVQKGCSCDSLPEGVLRPWIYFNGWQKGCDGEGFQLDNGGENYKTGPGVFMRYLLYTYQNNQELRDYIKTNFRDFIMDNAYAVMYENYECGCCMHPITKGQPYDVCNLACQTNRLATLIMALAIL
ncbi:MAG: glycoside hydrolase family 76 protein [Deltaproteobacteria bacterium]|nr:glycoside hydrolase family 76 protein [Deltaproteobacteria bacterium]